MANPYLQSINNRKEKKRQTNSLASARSAIQREQQKRQNASDAYNQRLREWIHGGSPVMEERAPAIEQYASMGPKAAQQVQSYLTSPTMYSPKDGDLLSANYDTTRIGVLDQELMLRDLIGKGYFDNEGNLYGGNAHLTSRDYRNNALTNLQKMLADSQAADAANVNTSALLSWKTDRDSRGKSWDEFDADDLMTFDRLVNGNERWDFNPSSQEDVDRYNALVDQWRGTDFDTLFPDAPYKSQTEDIQAKIDAITKANENEDMLATLRDEAHANPSFAELSVYSETPSDGSTGNALLDLWGAEKREYVGAYEDEAYFVNNPMPYAQQAAASEHSLSVQNWLNHGLNMMTADEVALYNYYRNDPEKLAQFMDAIAPDLMRRRALVNDVRTRQLALNPWTAVPTFVGATLANMGSAFFSPVQMVAEGLDLVDGGDYDPLYDLNRGAEVIFDAQYSSLDNGPAIYGATVPQWGYKIARTISDNLGRAALGPTGALLAAAGQSASGKLYDNADRDDMSGAAKVLQAGLTAALEAGTEKIGLDALFNKGVPGAAKYVRQLIASEMGEEAVAYIGDEAIEFVVSEAFGHKGEYATGADFWNGLGETLLTTALSSGLMGTPGAVSIANRNKATGKTIQENESVNQLLDLGVKMPKETQSYQDAKKIKDTIAKGGKLSLGKLGRLAESMHFDLGERNSQIVDQIVDEAIVGRMVELGDDAQVAQGSVEAIKKASRGEELTKQERAVLAESSSATQVVAELAGEASEDDGGEWTNRMQMRAMEATAGTTQKMQAVYKAATKEKRTDVAAAERGAAKLTGGKQGNKGTWTKAAVEFDGGVGDIVRFASGKDGTLDAVVKTTAGEKTVPYSSITRAEGSGVATVLEWVNKSATKLTAEEANQLLATYQAVGGDAGDLITEYSSAFDAGFYGRELPSAKRVDNAVVQQAYDAGKRMQTASDEARAQRVKAGGKRGGGTVTFLGQVSSNKQVTGMGTEAALQAATRSMTASQRSTVDGLKAIAKATGVDMVLFSSTAEGRAAGVQNGSFAAGTNTIYLDINAGVSTEGALNSAKKAGVLGYATIRTAAHELTHFIEANSADGYAALKQQAKREFEQKGKKWEDLVLGKINSSARAGERLTRQGAEAEVIADACEMMLQDASAIERIARQNPSLKDKIAGFIKNFVKKIRDALRAIGPGSAEAKALMDMRDGLMQYSEELTRLWGVALEEAVGNTSVEQMEADGEVRKFSARHIDQLEEDKYFKSSVDKWDGASSGGRMKIGKIKPGSIYTAIGLPAENLYFDYSKAATALNKHGDHLSKGIIKQIPQMLASPIVITEPINKQVKNTVNVFGEMVGVNGKPIMVAIMMRPDRSGSYLLNVVRTVEMRQDIDRLITDDSVLYLSQDKKRTAEWFQGLGNISVPFAGTKSGFIRSIVYQDENVNQKSIRDTEYLSAVESGDMVTAQRMVDEAAREAGYEPLRLYHGTRNFGFTRFDTEKSDDKISLFVTDNRRIAESYSREDAGSSLKDSVKADRYDFMQKSSKALEPYVQKHVNKNLRAPTAQELREHTDRESAFILSSMDWVTDYFTTNEKNMNRETRQALANIMYYGGKLAAIPTAKMEDETDGYALRMKYEDAVSDLMWENRDVFDEIAPVIGRGVYESANQLISARFSDPFYDENTGAFVNKWDVTDKLGDKLFSGIYELYGDRRNLLEIDAKDSNWNTIDGSLIGRPGVWVTTREVAEYAKQHGYAGARISNVRDGGGMTAYQGASTVSIYFDNTSLKSADPVTYDDAGNVIPLSERFQRTDEDIRYSLRDTAQDEDASPDGTDIDISTDSAYQQYSIRTWGESDYVAKREEAIDRLVNTLKVDREKAAKWIDDVNSIAAYVLDNKARLDYIPTAVEGVSAFKSNPEYGGSIDMSTICAKRRLATGTLDAIQMRLGDAVLTKDDFLHIREMMKERGHEVACGLCFVESSRKNLSKYTKQFLDQFNASHPDNQVSMTDFNTVDGLERVRLLNQEAYGEYEKFMNKLAQRKPKLFEKRTEYRHEILQRFKKDTTVGAKNLNGGLRLQSFSDFEIVHLIDMMQVISDMASVGLAGQAYTKVPDFAWALGDTGLKINLSLIAKGVDDDGNLIFDDVEGMNHEEAKRIRDAYSKNVGTIVVTFTDEQLMAAMKSDFVDFIIPFHRSQWQKGDYRKLGLPEGTKDYTLHQNEKEGRKRVKSNYMPNDYWDFSKTGKENAQKYLDKCAADGRTPKFAKFLQNNGDGTYSMKADGSTDGYWKLLIDFKMYDNDGTGSPQMPVQPNFNMDEAMRMLREYKGEHDTFPVAQDVVDDFVAEYTGSKGGIKVSNGRVTLAGTQLSQRLPDDISTREYLADADSSIADTTEQANALEIYKSRIKAYRDAVTAVEQAKATLAATTDRDESIKAKNRLDLLQKQQARAYDQLIAAENTQHIRELTGKTTEFIQKHLAGKTEADIAGMIAEAENEIASLTEQLSGVKGASREQAEATKEQIRMLKARVTRLRNSATRKLLQTRQHYQEMFQRDRDRREINAEAAKKAAHIKRVVKRLNDRIMNEGDYHNVKQNLQPAVRKVVEVFAEGFGNLVFNQKSADRLLAVYRQLDSLDSAESAFYSDDVEAMLEDLARLAEDDAVRRNAPGGLMENAEMKLSIYSQAADIADNIWHMVQMADEIFVDGKRQRFAYVGDNTGKALLARKDYKQLYGNAGKLQRWADEAIRVGNLTPTYFFEGLKNSGLSSLFQGIANGQTAYAQAILDGQTAMQEAKKRYHYAQWANQKPVEFKTKQGHTFSLTAEQMMWAYATAKREASNELASTHHLSEGGFRFEGEQRMSESGKGKHLSAINKPHKLASEDIEAISNALTAEQKAYADEMVRYLSEDMAELGNAASMEMFGIRKYQERYYFPFKTASEQRYQRSDAGSTSATNDSRVKHSSFTHRLTRNANTTLVMGDFSAVVADHINQMATYASFMNPVESMNRVLNYKVAEDDGTEMSIRSLLERKYGAASQRYVQDFLKDINGGVQTDTRGAGFFNALIRTFKRGAVASSLSTAVQQPTAYLRAFAYLDPKYFAHLTGTGNKEAWAEAMRYSGTAVVKDMGKFDVGLGQTANEWISKADESEFGLWERAKKYLNYHDYKTLKTKWSDLLSALPGYLDRVTWTHIWKAVKAEQADLHPGMNTQSEAFLEMCGKRFDDVINHTQVYDSIIAKSSLMRSSNALHQMATAFKSEPTLTANVLYNAVTGKHSKGQKAKMITATVASNILAAAFAAAIGAWNKDEDDRSALEKYLDKFGEQAMSNLNPLNMLPYLSDISSMLDGYDVERLDMSVIADIIDYSKDFWGTVYVHEWPTWKQWEDYAGTLLNMLGVHAKNISRDIRRFRNAVTSNWDTTPTASTIGYTMLENLPYGWYDGSNKAYYARYASALVAGNKQEAYNLKDFLLTSKGVTEENFSEQTKKVLGSIFQAGGMTEEEAKSLLLANGYAADAKAAFQTVDRWKEGSEGYSPYNTLRQAFEADNETDIQKAIDELVDNGYTKDEISNYIKQQKVIREAVESGSLTPSRATYLLRKYAPYANDKDNVNKPKEWAEKE